MKLFLCVFGVLIGLAFARVTNKYSTGRTNFTFPNTKSDSKNPTVRIVGGQQAFPHQFPFQVGLFIQYQLTEGFCGGSLVSKNYVLTAAHCAEGAVSIDVVLGAHNISDDSESSKQRITSTTYVVHPQWDIDTITNDLALIKLPTPAVINTYVQIVKLASGTGTYAGNPATVSGWGKTTDVQTAVTDILRYAENRIITNSLCKAVDPDYAGVIQSTHLCLSGDGNTSICQGDSGGPLLANGLQVGISSFSYRSCEASKPSVFTRLTEYQQWIQANSDVSY